MIQTRLTYKLLITEHCKSCHKVIALETVYLSDWLPRFFLCKIVDINTIPSGLGNQSLEGWKIDI